MISKGAILKQVIKQLGEELETLAGVSRAMHADASDEQNKAEDKYDTRSLETAYIANSQARQATATEEALAAYQTLKLLKFTTTTPIHLSALIELDSRGERIFYFLGPNSGGLEIEVADKGILVITPESPMGQHLIGRRTGDRFKLQTRVPAQEFKIISVR